MIYTTLRATVIETMISTSTSKQWDKLHVWWHVIFFIELFRDEDKTSIWIEVVNKIETIIGTAIPLKITVTTTIIIVTVIALLSAS